VSSHTPSTIRTFSRKRRICINGVGPTFDLSDIWRRAQGHDRLHAQILSNRSQLSRGHAQSHVGFCKFWFLWILGTGVVRQGREWNSGVFYCLHTFFTFSFLFLFFLFFLNNNNSHQNIFILFIFYITSIIFYYYSNKKNHYNTNFFLFFYFISHHYFLLILKLTTNYSILYLSLPNNCIRFHTLMGTDQEK